jgi:hypothetical protein
MTFTEAAVEVLRLVGKPLHYKKITEVAIERNLLSHVGKTPEVTMSSRLATMVKRDRGEAPIIKVKPGVFGLRGFSEEQLADLSGDVDELPEAEVSDIENAKPEEAEAAPESAEGAEVVEARPSIVVPRKPLPGADVFPEEDDDDEPILGGDDDDDDEEEGEAGEGGEAGQGAESRSQRRRRKRRRRGGADEPAEEPRPAQERDASREAGNRDAVAGTGRESGRENTGRENTGRENTGREARSGRRDEPRGRRDEPRGRRDARADVRDRDGRERDREARDRDARDRDGRERDNSRFERRDELQLDMSREPADGDLLGKELADAVASVLAQSGPRGMPAIRVADMLVRKGRLAGDPNALLPTVMAAVRADTARRRHEPRPRFRVEGSTLLLTDFLLPQEVVRAEQDVLRAASQQRDRVRRAFLRKLSELPAAGLAELCATWLNAEGVVGLRAVRRPSTAPGELHLAGTLRRGPEEVRLAVIVCRDGRELGREKIVEARGALHHYGNATTAWIITLGSVMSGAREEALMAASAPVALFDGLGLASAMERVGVGIGTQHVTISSLDFELLDALRGSVPREREARGRDRGERDRDRDRDRDRGDRDRDRGDRDRDRDRGERERPRLVLERPNAGAAEELDDQEEREEVVELAEVNGAEVGEEAASAADATPEAADATGEAQGDREGGRRRRRRRRRRGRGAEGEGEGEGTALAEGEAAPADDAEDDEESEASADEEPAAPAADDARPDGYDDEGASRDDDDAERLVESHDDDDDDELDGERTDDDEEGGRELDRDEDARRQDDDD